MVQGQDMNQGMDQNTNMNSQPQQQGGGGRNNMLIFAVLGVVIVILIIAVAYFALSSTASSTASTTATTSVSSNQGTTSVSQSSSQNSTPIEMSYSQAQALLRSSLSQYSGYDLFKLTSPTNISDLDSVVPQLYGNATSGWVTYAAGSNATANATIEYVVIATKDTKQIASNLNNATLANLSMTLKTANSGLVNGFNYTYVQYVNSTASFQSVSGYKNDYVVDAVVNSYPAFTMNETSLVNAVANDTP